MKLSRLLLSMTALVPAAALAQNAQRTDPQPNATATAGDDIIVTARKREENLQKVPLAITAFGAQDIQSARIERLSDVAKLTPGLNFTPLFGRQNQLPIIRGAAQTFGQLNVGVFLDGIYLSGKGGVDLELNDLERIEVIKGPQSALYGRNTFAGAINYVTKRPSRDDFHGRAELTAGGNGLYKSIVSFTGPITDTLRFQVGGFGRKFDGWYTSAIDGGRVDFERSYGVSGTLEWQPVEPLIVTLRGSYQEYDDGQPPSSVIRTNAGPGVPAGAAIPGVFTTTRNLLFLGEVPAIPRNGVTSETVRTPNLPSAFGDREHVLRLSAALSYDAGPATLTSVTSYSYRKAEYTFDGDNTICDQARGCPSFGFPFAPALPLGSTRFALSSNDGYLRDYSQEFRITSTGKRKVDYLLGLFYYHNDNFGIDRGLSPITTPAATAYADWNPNYAYPRQTVKTDSFAAFGSVTWHATDQLSLTGELRYEYEQQSFAQSPTYVTSAPRSSLVFANPTAAQVLALAQYDAAIAADAVPSPVPVTASTPFVNSPTIFPTPQALVGLSPATAFVGTNQDFRFVTPRFIVNYQANNDLLVYASFARGAKTGGFNTGLNVFANQRTYQPEYSDNYEIGFKSDLFDRRVRFNAAAYYINWTDQQAACQNPITAGGSSTNRTYICNVAASKIYGLELDGSVRIADWLSVNANYTYTHARYTRFVDDSLAQTLAQAGLPPIDFNGRRLPYVPDHKFVVSPRIGYNLGEGRSIEARADVSYQSRTYVRADNLQNFGEKTVVDLRLTARFEPFIVQLFANNVFDNDRPVAAVRFFDATNYFVSSPLVTGANRRQLGVSIGMKF